MRDGADPPREDVLRSYRQHPLTARAILRRLRRDGKRPPYGEIDLAFDPSGDVTDQNHVGGPASVMALARRAGISSDARVLDLGCGLGGPARLLRSCFGCSVRGVDLSARRVVDARYLTAVVGIDRVTFEHLDFMEAPCKVGAFDVAWGQSSWSHAEDIPTYLGRIGAHITGPGIVAFEEPVLVRRPAGHVETRLLQALSTLWHSKIVPAEVWLGATEAAGFSILHTDDLTERMSAHYGRILMVEPGGDGPGAARELEAALLARRLIDEGVLGRRRIVGQRNGRHHPRRPERRF